MFRLFHLMPVRLLWLEQVYSGSSLAGVIDDPGIYLVVPRVAHGLNISVVAAYNLTIGFCLIAAAVIGALGIKDWNWKKAVYFFGAIGATAFVGDVYIFPALPAIAGIPWLLRDHRHMFWIVGLAGLCEIFRTGSALPYVAMIAVLYCRKKPLLTVISIILAFAPLAIIRHEYKQGHPIWHSIYIGLGFVHNSEVPRYVDEIGTAKATQMGITPYTPEYEKALRAEVIRIAETKPLIIAGNVLVKMAAIVLMLAIVLFPKFSLPSHFIFALCMASLPGILVTPNPRYIWGAFVIAALCIRLDAQPLPTPSP